MASLSSSPSNINIPCVKSDFIVIIPYEEKTVLYAKSNPSEYLTSWKYLPFYKYALKIKIKYLYT